MIDPEPLLALQARDLALDRLRHRRATLPERDLVATGEARAVELRAEIERVGRQRDEIAHEEQRLGDEASTLSDQAGGAEAKLYSGEISSPRELQALQADVEQLRRHQRGVEDRELAAMERREPLDARLAEIEAAWVVVDGELTDARGSLAAVEAEVVAEAQIELDARNAIATDLAPELLAAYERCRETANGVGAARLVAGTCQGCHLSIPATEVDRIRRRAGDEIAHCDNCGCILVLST